MAQVKTQIEGDEKAVVEKPVKVELPFDKDCPNRFQKQKGDDDCLNESKEN